MVTRTTSFRELFHGSPATRSRNTAAPEPFKDVIRLEREAQAAATPDRAAQPAPTLVLSRATAAPAVRSEALAIRVPEFESWFEDVRMCYMAAGAGRSYTMNRAGCASEQGAAEALRLVRKHVPDATIVRDEAAGPWQTDNPVYQIGLPNGEQINAGLLLDLYYRRGAGPDGLSEQELASGLEMLLPNRARIG